MAWYPDNPGEYSELVILALLLNLNKLMSNFNTIYFMKLISINLNVGDSLSLGREKIEIKVSISLYNKYDLKKHYH